MGVLWWSLGGATVCYFAYWLYENLFFWYDDHIVLTIQDQEKMPSRTMKLVDANGNPQPEFYGGLGFVDLTKNETFGQNIDGGSSAGIQLFQFEGNSRSVQKFKGDWGYDLHHTSSWWTPGAIFFGKAKFLCEQGFKKSSGWFNWFGTDFYDQSEVTRCDTEENWRKHANEGAEKTIHVDQPSVFNNQRTLPVWTQSDIDRALGVEPGET